MSISLAVRRLFPGQVRRTVVFDDALDMRMKIALQSFMRFMHFSVTRWWILYIYGVAGGLGLEF